MSRACGGYLSGADQGEFFSPDYPEHYPPRMICIWLIKVVTGSSIRLIITDMDTGSTLTSHGNAVGTEGAGDTCGDYIEVQKMFILYRNFVMSFFFH